MPQAKLKIGVIGASGYTGGELLRLLIQHPRVKITAITAEKSAGTGLSDLFPNLHSFITQDVEPTDLDEIHKKIDVIFLALPHTKSMEPVSYFAKTGKMILDLSADFRLSNPHTFQTWYHTTHRVPSLLKTAVYGLPELHRAEIRQSNLVAVPGCYPTAAILQLAPLVANKLIKPHTIIIDAKSGISGAGRNPGVQYHFPEAHDSVKAYKIGEHRHTPEIEQELNRLWNPKPETTQNKLRPRIKVTFTPHLVPLNRGILSTAYAQLSKRVTLQDLQQVFRNFYQGEKFIRFQEDPLALSPLHVRGSNFCDMGIFFNQRTKRAVCIATLDNLVKGAAGQAVQAMNLMAGFPEEMGLMAPSPFP